MRAFLSPKNITLGAVAPLLFLVSVPRVHQLAVQDNQRDAQSAVRALAQEAFRGSTPGAMDAQRLSLLLGERLRDVRYNENSGLIQRHGYLFEVLSTPTGQGLVRAWPVAHGDTGVVAYVMAQDTALLTHQNSDAIWSGASTSRPTGQESGGRESAALR